MQGRLNQKAAPSQRKIHPLVAILIIGAVARIALWLWFAGMPIQISDEQDYNVLAISLVERGEFAYSPGNPASLRPPLYPALVAGMYSLFGVESFQAVRLLQAGLSLLTVWLLFKFGCEAFSQRVGVWLSGLYAFYPSMLGYNNLLLTEVVFTFFLCAACFSLVLFWKRDSIGYAAASGCLFGLAALTRSVLWLWPIVLCAFMLIFGQSRLSRRAASALALFAAFALTLAPWSIRTSRLEKTFTAVDTMGGRNLMMGNYEYTPLYRSWDAISMEGEESWDSVLSSHYPESGSTTQGQRDKLAARAGIEFVLKHPGLTLQRDVVKLMQFWGLERELIAGLARGLWGECSAIAMVFMTLVICGSYVASMLTSVFGLFLAPPSDRRIHGSLLLITAFICGMHTLVFAHSRYHLPLMPIVLAYSASAIANAREVWIRRRSPVFWLACGFSTLLLVGWAWEMAIVERERFLQLFRSLHGG